MIQHENVRESLLIPEPKNGGQEQMSLFAEVAKDDYNPKPVADYPPVSFLEIAHVQR